MLSFVECTDRSDRAKVHLQN